MCLLRKFVCVLLLCLSFIYPTKTCAQDGVFYEVNLNFSNAYMSTASNILKLYMPGILRGDLVSYDINYLDLKDNGENVLCKQANYWGFKADDLFSWVDVNLKIGWFGKVSPIGIYGQLAYEHQRNKLCFQHDTDYGSYRTNAFKPGLGIRVIPFRSEGVVPILEVGTSYVLNFGAKTPYGSDKSQFNDGMAYSFALGVTWGMDEYGELPHTIRAGITLSDHDYFNREWSNDGGYYFPYANVKAKDYKFFVKYTRYF